MKNISISEAAFDYLSSMAIPLIDTPATALDKLIAEHRELRRENAKKTSRTTVISCSSDHLPNVTHTSIRRASIGGNAAPKYWNELLSDLLEKALHAPRDLSWLRQHLPLSLLSEPFENNGYRRIGNSGFAFQGVDANRACKAIALLAEDLRVPVEMEVTWSTKPKAELPGETRRLSFGV
ncbi:T4SS efffector SepA family protein [Pseudooceanicola aestuarii]|uniref:T4SS efffector SepA family protein n=1 Tax=Pseudooceanicola aestuarii TaxID=2697319 RepID=UPI0013D0C78E|nr:hypothetical protein [Pseudooceanicola aestuarii]